MFRKIALILPFLVSASFADTAVVYYEAQAPEMPGVYDAPETTVACSPSESYTPLEAHLLLPDAGIGPNTGLLVNLPGLSTGADCTPTPATLSDWHNSKDLVVATIAYRNLAYRFPTDFGKLNIGDVLRGTGAVLEAYDLNEQRIYLYGGSGGGHMALQVYQATPYLWNEVHAHAGITKITTAADVSSGYATRWNGNLSFPESQGALDDETWARYQAERNLRGPQFHVLNDPVIGGAPIRIFHGTSDPLVSFRHFSDYRDNLYQALNVSAPDFGVVTEIEQYTFIEIRGGNHSYAGAVEDENTRTKASEKYFPDCFTSVAEAPPAFWVDYTTAFSEGYAFRIHGNSLSEVRVDVVRPTASVSGWMAY